MGYPGKWKPGESSISWWFNFDLSILLQCKLAALNLAAPAPASQRLFFGQRQPDAFRPLLIASGVGRSC